MTKDEIVKNKFNLSNADLYNANLINADLSNADLRGAIIRKNQSKNIILGIGLLINE